MNLPQAIETLVESLNNDAGYRFSWQANIAVQFQDEWKRVCESEGPPLDRETIHEISNKAAINFLHLLCMDRSE